VGFLPCAPKQPPTRHIVRNAHDVPPKSELRSSRPQKKWGRDEDRRCLCLCAMTARTASLTAPRHRLLTVIASAAKQSMILHQRRKLDCFVAPLLAKTSRITHSTPPHSRDAFAPESLKNVSPRIVEGVGNAGCSMHPQPRMQNKKAYEHSHHRLTGFTRHSRTPWF